MEQEQTSAEGQEPQSWVNPTPTGRYDLVVVGATPEAVIAARAARASGRRAALVGLPSPDETPPGDPTAAGLRAAAYAMRQAAAAVRSGAPGGPPGRHPPGSGRLDFAALVERARRLQEQADQVDLPRQLADAGIDVYWGPARFTDHDTLDVEGCRLAFRRAILAPGSAAGPTDLAGAGRAGCTRGDDLLGLAELPARLAVVGLGPSQCQWAQTFARLGSHVHLIGPGPGILPAEDPRAARLVEAQLQSEGVSLHLGCDELSVERMGHCLAVLLRRGARREKLFADRVLADAPRRPGVERLALPNAGVTWTERGVLVDDALRTSNRRVFAAGEVCGPEFSCPAAAEAMVRLAVRNALGWTPRRFDRLLVPRCVDTDPQVVSIGLSAEEAALEHLRISTYRVELSESQPAIARSDVLSDAREAGFAEVRVRSRSGRIVGATVVARRAPEWIGPLMLLQAQGLPLDKLEGVFPCHGTRLDLLRRLARRCRQAQPPHFWSIPLEWAETTWRRLRQRWRGETASGP